MHDRPSFAGAAIEVRDLQSAIAFHRVWLPTLGFRRVWAEPGRVMWARGYDHFVLRQAAPDDLAALGSASKRVWLAFAADDRAQVDVVHRAVAEAGAEIVHAPQPFDYFPPGYYSLGFRDPEGLPIEIVHRWADLPEVEGGEKVRVPGADGVSLGGYLFRPLTGRAPHPAILSLHGFAGHAAMDAAFARQAAAAGFAVLALSLRGWLGSEGETDQGLRQPHDVVAAVDWLARRPFVDPRRIALSGASMGGQVALLAAAAKAPVAAVAAWFPSADMARLREQNPHIGDYLDDLCGVAGLAERSPIHRAADIDVPVLLMHGDKDENVPVEQSLRMADALRAAGKTVEILLLSGASHYFTERERDIARQRLFTFLRAHLGRG